MGSGSGSSLKSPDRRRTNRQGRQGLHPELCSSKVKVFLVKVGARGTVRFPEPSGSARPTGRPSAPASEANFTMITDSDHESNQANRAISTSKLNTLPRLHTWPINVVVFHGSQGSTRFKVGFPLRCLQRLSRPYIATLHCGWRHNSSTRGTSIPVLSY
jgi:hypothetical protein